MVNNNPIQKGSQKMTNILYDKRTSVGTLIALAISAFAIGSTEFISVGLLPLLANQFSVSLETAGLTVSIYAIGITVGAPLMTLLTGSIPRKNLLMITMLLFITGNLIAAFAPSFLIVLLGRIVAALAHGIFMTISSLIAANVVTPDRRASAIAIMFTGLTVATVTGVPLGTFIGQLAGWRLSFIFLTIIGAIGLLANLLLIPNGLPNPGKTSIKGILTVFSNRKIVYALLMTAFGYGGTFAVYTYISPILEKLMGYSTSAVVWLLLVYGVMVAIGNTVGGRMANSHPEKALIKMFAGLAGSLLLIGFFINQSVLGLIAVLLMGLFAFMNAPGLQLYIVTVAEKEAPSAVTMASALNISAFNIGIALGSLLGGQVTAHFGLAQTPWIGIVMVILAILINGRLIGVVKREIN
ncbi:transport protein [Secundilactobacillus malefermentans DSM 5705 = KCTC 3548]|nr:transport protein [Secundilactobacillus malefermentans DSM 5705 = KCTC 3548]